MKKIISLFERNHDGDHLVRDEITPGAEWVMFGEGVATQKFDGTACLIQGGRLFKRCDAKSGKVPPPGFLPAQEPDSLTGHWPGWVPVGNGPEDKFHREALETKEYYFGRIFVALCDGTYELCGPKINGNPERVSRHLLLPHGATMLTEAPRDFNALREYLMSADMEGIVWWRDPDRPDCDKVKIKGRDFGLKRSY